MEANIAVPAALVGDPTRAAMLLALMGGETRSAGALARIAGVSAQVASNHLTRLTQGGLLRVAQVGRERRYRLAGADVAAAIEALGRIAPPIAGLNPPISRAARAIREARSCYDHLAGRLGVAVTEAMLVRGLLALPSPDAPAFELTASGERWLQAFGVDTALAPRAFARCCMDWTERRPHLAGALGARLLARLLSLGWVARAELGRGLRLTQAGAVGLRETLGVDLHADREAA